MSTLRFRATGTTLSATLIARFRQVTQLSISEIRDRVGAGKPLFEVTPFKNNWRNDRQMLVRIANDIQAGILPLTVTEVHANQESSVSAEMLRNLILHFRQIELETQMDTMLELGEIDDPSQFSPYDDDWTQ